MLLVSQEFLGNTLMEHWSSVVFALSGIYAGQPITLSQAMGLEQEAGTEPDIASELVYGLVWQIVQYEIAAMQKAYFPDVTEADFRRAFSPERDFYFDEDGNFVFFIQAGTDRRRGGRRADVSVFPGGASQRDRAEADAKKLAETLLPNAEIRC